MNDNIIGWNMSIWYEGRERNIANSGFINTIMGMIQFRSKRPFMIVTTSLMDSYGYAIMSKVGIKRINDKTFNIRDM